MVPQATKLPMPNRRFVARTDSIRDMPAKIKAKDLSIVVVTWNAKEFTRDCLESLEQQDIAQLSSEIIVVDNASSDGTTELISERFPNVRLVKNFTNNGFAQATNIGIRLSEGQYILLVNSDVTVPAGCLCKIFAFMEQNPEVGLMGPKMLGSDGAPRRSCMRFPTLWATFCRMLALDAFTSSRTFGGLLMKDFNHDRVIDVDVLNGWFWVVRREALATVGLLDEQFFIYGEDLDWCYRFHVNKWRVAFFPGAEATHHGGASSAKSPIRFYIEMQKANLQYWKKHHGRLAERGYRIMLWVQQLMRLTGYAGLYVIRSHCRSESSDKMRRSLACLFWLSGLRFHKGAEVT